MLVRRAAIAAAGALVLATLTTPAMAGPSSPGAQPPAEDRAQASADAFTGVPTEVPAAFSPDVENGQVNAIAQVGNQIVLGGTFTSVTPKPGATVTRSYLVAFNKDTGVINAAFNPTLNNTVEALEPAADGTSVYVGGTFTTVNGQTQRRVTRLQLSNGAVVPGFSAPSSDGKAETIRLKNGRLFVGGAFRVVNGVPHAGFITLNPNTGALDPYMNLQISGHHNDTGSGAQGAIRVDELVITPDGTSLFAIGNFKRVDGLLRDQAVRVSLTGATAVVDPNWSTNGFSPYCASWAFDSWVRGISMSPDGRYFVVATTGAPFPGTLCDTASRWEVSSSGLDVKPTWVNYTGGDTLFAVEVAPDVVFVGGHQRWTNNPTGTDSAQPGAIPAPGLMALDPASGTPLSWNAGRNPRGVAVFDMLATADGLWLGSDTEWIGNYQYRRERVAFFPRNGGYPALSRSTGSLPGEVYIGGAVGDSLDRTTFNGTTTTPLQATGITGPAWGSTRGAVQVGDRVFYGFTDAKLYYRTFNGSSFGPQVFVDPYHDPTWVGVGTGSGSTTYTGVFPDFYDPGHLSSVTGMIYADGKLFYTRFGQSSLFWRWFNPDSGAVHPQANTSSGGIDWTLTNGMFLNGTDLYVVNSLGQLLRYTFADGVPSGAGVIANAQIDWRGRAVFLYAGAPNVAPVASFTTSCENFTCSFDGSASSDSDGTVMSYAWNFGDSGTATGVTTSHTYANGGNYTVTLTVTDNRSGTGSTTRQVTVPTGELADITFRAASSAVANGSQISVTVPAATQPDDALLLFVSSGSAGTPTTPAGWTAVNANNADPLRTTVLRRTAVGGDAGKTVTVALGTFGKASAIIAAYAGVDPAAPVSQAVAASDANQTTHTTPGVTVNDHESVISYWVDRSSAASGWTVAAPATERIEALGSGGGRHTAVLGDDGQVRGPGALGNRSATAVASSSRAVTWSVVLKPVAL